MDIERLQDYHTEIYNAFVLLNQAINQVTQMNYSFIQDLVAAFYVEFSDDDFEEHQEEFDKILNRGMREYEDDFVYNNIRYAMCRVDYAPYVAKCFGKNPEDVTLAMRVAYGTGCAARAGMSTPLLTLRKAMEINAEKKGQDFCKEYRWLENVTFDLLKNLNIAHMNQKNMIQVIWSSSIVEAIAGELYYQAPRYKPRNASIIMDKFVDALYQYAGLNPDQVDKGFEIRTKNLSELLHKILFNIPEFVDLNLSQDEYEKGIKVDDPKRSPFLLVDRYTKIPWRSDFIDPDALVQNVSSRLERFMNFETVPEKVEE